MKKYDVVSLGEILIDFTYSGKSSAEKNLYEENTGGAPANCASCVSKLGGRSAFIGCTGNDSFGMDVRNTLKNIGVDISFMQYTENQHTTLAFVTLAPNGERTFSFCRNPGADTRIDFDLIDKSVLDEAIIFHVGSLSLTDEPARTATIKSIEHVKKSGGAISYDPNWREALWRGKENAIEKIKSLFAYADLVKISDEELHLLFGNDCDCRTGAEKLHAEGVKLVTITLGKDGTFYSYRNAGTSFSGTVKGFKIDVVDTTGAGDSFFGALLFCLTRKEKIYDFTQQELEDNIKFSNAVAALCVSKRGAIPALPTKEQTENFLKIYVENI